MFRVEPIDHALRRRIVNDPVQTTAGELLPQFSAFRAKPPRMLLLELWTAKVADELDIEHDQLRCRSRARPGRPRSKHEGKQNKQCQGDGKPRLSVIVASKRRCRLLTG